MFTVFTAVSITRGKAAGEEGLDREDSKPSLQAWSSSAPCWRGNLSTSEYRLMSNPVTFPFSSERLMGADSAGWSQPAGPCAHRHPADLATQHELPLPAGVREHHPAQELKLGGPPGWGSVLFFACTGRSVPHTRVSYPTPISLHPFHNSVQ